MEQTLPPNFRSLISDFVNDLSITYSDYSYLWSKWAEPEITDSELQYLFDYCIKVYPDRFFDIIYQRFQKRGNTVIAIVVYFLQQKGFETTLRFFFWKLTFSII